MLWSEYIREYSMKKSFFESHRGLVLSLALLAVLDALLWRFILFPTRAAGEFGLYFLDVGQGDSELLVLPGPHGETVRVLIDGGPDASVLRELGKVLGPADRRVDLLMMTHPQLDHFGGFTDVITRYDVGMFLGNGRKGDAKAYGGLHNALAEKKVPYLTLGEGDRIRYGDATITILSPSPSDTLDAELNTTCLVALLEYHGLRALYTGDIDANVESRLVHDYNIQAQVLKVPHHGSRFSSSEAFLAEVSPSIAAIEVGAKNRYGHPTKDALNRLAAVGAHVFRTDQSGTVGVRMEGEKLKVFVERK